MSLEIRDARPEDAEAMIGILNPIIEAGVFTALDTPLTVEDQHTFIRSFPARGVFHVAVLDGRVVGLQNLDPFASYTHAFDHVGVMGTYVDLRYRRRGIARRLFEATFAAAVRKGYEKVFTYVRAGNDAALRAYLSQGFTVIGTARRQARIRGRYVDEVLIEKFLGETEEHASGRAVNRDDLQTTAFVGAVVRRDDAILFVRQSAGHPLAGQWTVPWGRVDAGESPAAAAIRETWEEGGVRAEVEGLLGVQELPAPQHGSFALVYLCRHVGCEPRPIDRETDAAAYYSLAALEALSEPIEPWSYWLARRVFEGRIAVVPTDPSNPLQARHSFL